MSMTGYSTNSTAAKAGTDACGLRLPLDERAAVRAPAQTRAMAARTMYSRRVS